MSLEGVLGCETAGIVQDNLAIGMAAADEF